MPSLSDRNRALLIAISMGLWLAMLMLGGPASSADAALLHAFAIPAFIPAARAFTRLGDWGFLLPATLAASALVLISGARKRAALLLILVVSSRLLVEVQKWWFDRARPDPHGHHVAIHNMAFPSGHSANSMILWLGIALIAVTDRRLRGPAILLALTLSGLTGLTRLVLAVHWPSDVIGGWSFGAAWTLALARLAVRDERRIAEQASRSVILPSKESEMSDRNRPDDSDLIDEMENAPGQGGTSGGNLQRNVGSQAEEDDEVGDGGITRVTGEDKPRKGDEPNLPNRD
jgi:undecaprenyl-diphosphatase